MYLLCLSDDHGRACSRIDAVRCGQFNANIIAHRVLVPKRTDK